MFRASRIGWLPFEGLLRQKDIDFQWEIIVAEERDHRPFTEKRIREYQRGLAKLGCVRIKYLSLGSWIPLAAKWRLLAQHMSSSSEVGVLQAADAFPQPHRLVTNYKAIAGGAHWSQSPFYLLYDIRSDRSVVLYRRKGNSVKGNRHPCGENMAVSSNLLRRLPRSVVRRGVDWWLYQRTSRMVPRMIVAWDMSDDWKYGMNTVGFNYISRYGNTFRDPKPPYGWPPFDMRSTIPEPVMVRLGSLRKFL